MSKLQPIIKWSGSKRSQAEQIVNLISKDYDTYYEPFCGGCSVLFYILNHCPEKFQHYVCSDVNKGLIDTFNTIKLFPNLILETYTELWKELNKDNDLERKKQFFNYIRKEFNETGYPCYFFFIMRTTTNGMPRYNAKGEFNNSFHVTRNGIEPERLKPILMKWSELLNKYYVDFKCRSYNEINPGKNDFMYLDPPYANTKGMYYGTIDCDILWAYLKSIDCDYFLSFDGIAGDKNNIANVPEMVYNKHMLLDSGNSSFRRVIGKNNNVNVKESLYIKVNDE